MSNFSDPGREYGRVRHAVLLGLFCGTGVGLGYLLSFVPGVELMTTNAVLAGAALGPAGGMVAGVLTQAVYSLGSPYGPPLPQVLAAQVVGMAVAGLAGGILGPLVRRSPARVAAALAAVAGVGVSLFYDLITNVAVAAALAIPLPGVLVAGAPLAAVHALVVATAWAVLLPLLAGRLVRLRRPQTRALVVVPLLAVTSLTVAGDGLAATLPADTLAVPGRPDTLAVPGPADSLSSRPGSPRAVPTDTLKTGARPDGWPANWQRPPWRPFHADLREKLARTSHWLPVRDGGPGSAAVILGEPGTGAAPAFRRDGVPLGVGHRYLDDVEALPLAGRRPVTTSHGLGPGGGLQGVITLAPRDPAPGTDLLDTRWYAGPHDSFLRDIQFLTADAPWRIGFDFYEIIDTEGFDFRVPGEVRYPDLDEDFPVEFWGQAKVRGGRGRLVRRLASGDRLTLSLENVRKFKHGMPVHDLEHQELWRNDASLRWQSGRAGDGSEAVVWWDDADLLVFADEAGAGRSIEGARSGVSATWAPADGPLTIDATYSRWSLRDSGADPDWAPAHADTSRTRGASIDLGLGRDWRLGPVPLSARVAGWWDQHGGAAIGGRLALGAARGRPGWRLALERGGRAPRGDEVATAWRTVVPAGRQTVMLPGPELDREREWRLAGSWHGALRGWNLEAGIALRRLRHGIGWAPISDQGEVGRWRNGVDLDATSIRFRIARAQRFLGWLRLEAAGSWHGRQRNDTLVIALPPRLQYRLSALWEHHFFDEDGIAQVGAYYHNRGAMDDPWFLADQVEVPGLSRLDLILGFRLVGTNLSAELHNVLGSQTRLTANAVSAPLELRWRLHWTFRH